jgi:DNA-directed RNA polymerase specialized sigma24 family protein
LDGDHYEILTPAADALIGEYPLAATMVLRAMIDFFAEQWPDQPIQARRAPFARLLQSTIQLSIEAISGPDPKVTTIAEATIWLRDAIARREIRSAIEKAVDELSPYFRSVFILRTIEQT